MHDIEAVRDDLAQAGFGQAAPGSAEASTPAIPDPGHTATARRAP